MSLTFVGQNSFSFCVLLLGQTNLEFDPSLQKSSEPSPHCGVSRL